MSFRLRVVMVFPVLPEYSGVLSTGVNRQMFHRVIGLNEPTQALLYDRPVKQFAEKLDFFFQLAVGNRLDEFFRGCARGRIKLGHLLRHGTGYLQRVAFAREMRHQPSLMRAFRLHRSPGEEQIANESVAYIAPQTWNATKTGDQTQTQLRKAEARHFVRYDQVADQRQSQAAAHAQAMHSREGNERRPINRIEHFVDSLQKSAHAREALLLRHADGPAV